MLVGAVAKICEREHSHDRRSILSRQIRRARRRLAGLPAPDVGAGRFPGPDMDLLFNVLETVIAGIDKTDAEMLAGLAMCLGGNGHGAGSRNRFKADGDVD